MLQYRQAKTKHPEPPHPGQKVRNIMNIYVLANDKKFSSIEDAISAFNDTDLETLDIEVYNGDTDDMLDYQTAERNSYSGDFVYYRWYIGHHADFVEVLDYDCNCEDEAREKAKKYIANDKYDDIFICNYSQTLSENIGDESVERIFLKGEKD